MKGAVLTALATAVVGAVGLGALLLFDVGGHGRPHGALSDSELRWVRALVVWPGCGSPLRRPPSHRLEETWTLARRSCGSGAGAGSDLARAWERLDGMLLFARPLPHIDGASGKSRIDSRLNVAASRVAGHPVQVHCWSERDWPYVTREWKTLSTSKLREYWPAGIAETTSTPRRVHLAPEVCGPLARFFYTPFAPVGTTESLELAEALITIAHEGEHIRRPHASEAVVECHAIQDVRHVVTAHGRSRGYGAEMAALAWQVAYPYKPDEYRTAVCHNGGPLDDHPGDRRWP